MCRVAERRETGEIDSLVSSFTRQGARGTGSSTKWRLFGSYTDKSLSEREAAGKYQSYLYISLISVYLPLVLFNGAQGLLIFGHDQQWEM